MSTPNHYDRITIRRRATRVASGCFARVRRATRNSNSWHDQTNVTRVAFATFARSAASTSVPAFIESTPPPAPLEIQSA
jgi:hypothetical protein